MRKHGKIIIELHSDICIHSGYSYRGTIDNDVCCDQYGIPFLPARRLKGCLREAAERIQRHPDLKNLSINDLFGKRGEFRHEKDGTNENNEIKPGNIYIENARIPHYNQICSDLESLQNTYLSPYLGRQDVLAQYTSLRTQTSMMSTCETIFHELSGKGQPPQAHIGVGCAKDNTLRSTRVINAITRKPVVRDNNKDYNSFPTRFEADIYYTDVADNDNEQCTEKETPLEKALDAISRSVRHIGLSRTRGLGSVTCFFEPDSSFFPDRNMDQHEKYRATDTNSPRSIDTQTDSDKATLFFSVRNIEPLMISQGNDIRSETYIPARNVIGALAWEYLSSHDNNDQSEEFRHLFLDGTVRYTNLYIMDGDSRCIPAPGFVNELKKTGLIVNSLRINEWNRNIQEEDPGHGNQPKKLKGKYICPDGCGFHKNEVKTSIIYHHRHNGSEDETGIYTQEVISAGQVFGGFIYCDPEKCKDKEMANDLLKQVELLLISASLRFGKSRTAQYGRCILSPHMPNRVDLCLPVSLKENADGHIIVCLVSDGIFCEKGAYTTDFKKVYQKIAAETGIADYVDLSSTQSFPDNDQDERMISLCDTGLVWGYNSKWNLRMQPVPAILAGSTFVYKIRQDLQEYASIQTFTHVGIRRTEGYGEARIFYMSKDDLPYNLSKIEETDHEEKEKSEVNNIPDESEKIWKTLETNEAKEIVRHSVLQNMSEEMRKNILRDTSGSGKLHLSDTTTGRVTLMLKEARETISPGENGIPSLNDAKAQFLDFAGRGDKDNPSRIRSIKRNRERQEIQRIIRTYFVKPENMKQDKDWFLDTKYMMEKLLPRKDNPDLYRAVELVFSKDEVHALQAGLWPEMMEALLTGNKYRSNRRGEKDE